MRRTDPTGQIFGPDVYVFGNAVGERVGEITKTWQRACRLAGIVGLTFHDLRREAASRLLEDDVPEQYVKEVLGNPDLTTPSRYLATTRKGLHQVMGTCEKKRGEGRTEKTDTVPVVQDEQRLRLAQN